MFTTLAIPNSGTIWLRHGLLAPALASAVAPAVGNALRGQCRGGGLAASHELCRRRPCGGFWQPKDGLSEGFNYRKKHMETVGRNEDGRFIDGFHRDS